MKKISVVLATFNEEKNLPRCLDSVKNLASEIVVVDGTSGDKTVEIAKEYGARVIIRENPLIFHINKQKAIDAATMDWILQLDADEIIDEVLSKEIKKAIEENEFDGYRIPRKNYFLGRFLLKGGQYPDYTLRLYKRGKGHLPQKDVHEQAAVDGKVGYLKNALLHYPYKNLSDYIFKWNRYNNIFANQIKKEAGEAIFFKKLLMFLDYLLIKPIYWFILTFIRHKGFLDSWQGFVFSFFSSLRFPVSYVKYLIK